MAFSVLHPAGTSINSVRFWAYSQFWLGFIIVVYEKIYFEAYTNDQYIWHKNNIAQLY